MPAKYRSRGLMALSAHADVRRGLAGRPTQNRRGMWRNQGIHGGAGSDDRKLSAVVGSGFGPLSPIASRGTSWASTASARSAASTDRAEEGLQL
jgi:hypothetical protein